MGRSITVRHSSLLCRACSTESRDVQVGRNSSRNEKGWGGQQVAGLSRLEQRKIINL